MQEAGVGHLEEMNPAARRILVVVSALESLLEERNGAALLLRLAQLGSAAGVHLFLSAATLSGIGGQLLYHLRPRLVVSGVEEDETRLALELAGSMKTPRLRDRQIAVREVYAREVVVGYMP